jgi:hypothetical protein
VRRRAAIPLQRRLASRFASRRARDGRACCDLGAAPGVPGGAPLALVLVLLVLFLLLFLQCEPLLRATRGAQE